MDELSTAAKRGVDVYFSIDARNFLMHERTRLPGPLWFSTSLPHKMPKPFSTHRAMLQKLTNAGGHTAIINQPKRRFTLPHAGSSHVKAAIVNDLVYVGGSNLEKPYDIDIMLQWRDDNTADWLYLYLKKFVETEHARATFSGQDHRHTIDDKTDLLIDAGLPGRSIILDEAFKLIDSARKWLFFTCQYVPHGAVADHLLAARKRGVKVTILFNHPSKHASYESLLEGLAKLHERIRLPTAYFRDELPKSAHFLHGKLIACDKGAMIGSHNYVTTGVRLGTAEQALLRRDEAFAQRLRDFLQKQL